MNRWSDRTPAPAFDNPTARLPGASCRYGKSSPSPSWSHSRVPTWSMTGSIRTVAGGIQVSLTNNGPDAFNGFLIQMVHVGSPHGAWRWSEAPAAPARPPAMSGAVCPAGLRARVNPHRQDHHRRALPAERRRAPLRRADLGRAFSPAGTATGPKPPCRCLSLDARIIPASISLGPGPGKVDHGPSLALDFTLHWTLRCSAGTGNGCTGTCATHRAHVHRARLE